MAACLLLLDRISNLLCVTNQLVLAVFLRHCLIQIRRFVYEAVKQAPTIQFNAARRVGKQRNFLRSKRFCLYKWR